MKAAFTLYGRDSSYDLIILIVSSLKTNNIQIYSVELVLVKKCIPQNVYLF